MFPTGVGMNRPPAPYFFLALHVPHRRGDEPATFGKDLINK